MRGAQHYSDLICAWVINEIYAAVGQANDAECPSSSATITCR
jgi:hypothetical protein